MLTLLILFPYRLGEPIEISRDTGTKGKSLRPVAKKSMGHG